MHADTATRQHWMSVLAHSQPAELAARLNALNITADYEVIRAAETGLVQIQARMGGTGERFFAGDATLTRAAVRLTDGTLGYSWVQGRDKQHAERCALIDALIWAPSSRADCMRRRSPMKTLRVSFDAIPGHAPKIHSERLQHSNRQ